MDDAQQTTLDEPKDPAEQEALARDLAADLTDVFVQFIRGEVDFAEVSFATYDVLQDLHIVAAGEYELVEDDEEEDDEEMEARAEAAADGGLADDYSEESATEQQEELSQEPSHG